jgi:hypothetical protein
VKTTRLNSYLSPGPSLQSINTSCCKASCALFAFTAPNLHYSIDAKAWIHRHPQHIQHARSPCLRPCAEQPTRLVCSRSSLAVVHCCYCYTEPKSSSVACRHYARQRCNLQQEAAGIPRGSSCRTEAAGATRECVCPQFFRARGDTHVKIPNSLTRIVGSARDQDQEGGKKKGGALSSLIYGTPEGRELDKDIERSFSQVLARGKYVHSIVFHSVKPDKVDEYTELVGKWYPKMASIPENKVHLVGSWKTEVGDCNTFGKLSFALEVAVKPR